MSHIIYPDLTPRNAPPAKVGRGQRLCREVLREGEWLIGDDPNDPSKYLPCTPTVIEAVRLTATERSDAGINVPLQWDHNPDNAARTDDSQKVVDYFEEFWVETHAHGQSLWAGCYPGDKFDELSKLKLPVSPFILWAVTDGTGRVWRNVLMHVALVDHATIPAQNGFVAMALPETRTPSVDFAKAVEIINGLLAQINPKLKIPDTVTDEAGLQMYLDMVASLTGSDADSEDSGDMGEVTPPGDVPTDPVAMALAPLNKELAQLRAEIAVLRGQKEVNAEQSFKTEVENAIAMGLPANARDSLIQLGKANEWDIKCLDSFKSMPGVSLGLKSTGSFKPAVNTEEDDLREALQLAGVSSEAIEKQLKRFK